ncbi:MAG: DegT/DnrJ/EryC1/StrS family aminotransferase, partial [Pseudomonadota bacterium]
EENGAPPVYWYENSWHYFENWEHLLNGKSLLPDGYPFKTASGESRCRFAADALPRTAERLSRTLTIPINIRMDDQIPKILKAIEEAAKTL